MKILVTAGPTREFVDPVRFLSNPSTGKMGYAVAKRGAAAGHTVRLVSGPVSLPEPGCEIVHVVSAQDMYEAVVQNVPWCDVLIMAAAVCDWQPAERHEQKLRKADMSSRIDLERTPDILREVSGAKGDRVFVGFAAETHDVVQHAVEKLESKRLDLIVANDVSRADSGFGVDTNQVILVDGKESTESLPVLPKEEVADRIIEWVAAAFESR